MTARARATRGSRSEGPLQWPVPARTHPGTARLYTDGRFPTDDGRARLIPVEHDPPVGAAERGLSAHAHDGSRPGPLAHAHADGQVAGARGAHARAPPRGQPARRPAGRHPRRRLRRDLLAARQGDSPGARQRDDPRGHLLPALPLGPAVGLLQGRQQPDALRARPGVEAAGAESLRRAPPQAGREPTVNKIEALKAEKDGLEIQDDLVRFAREGWKTIGDDDKERLKWVGVFMRRPTPGHAMMRIRMPNGVVTAAQVRLLARLTRESGRTIADITTRQQLQLRWVTIERVPDIIDAARSRGALELPDRHGQYPRHHRLPGDGAHPRRAASTPRRSRGSSSASSSATRTSPTCRGSST